LDRYAAENATRMVLEYYYPAHHERGESEKSTTFVRAQQETIKVIVTALDNVKLLSYDEFAAALKRGGIMRGKEFWPYQATADEWDELRRCAENAGESISDFVRGAIRKRCKESKNGERVIG